MVDEQYLILLEKAANGNFAALNCCQLACTYFHVFDDIIDKDIELTSRNLVDCNNVFLRLINNKFFQEHSNILSVIVLLIGDDYVASNENKEKWDCLRHAGINFVRTVALITGGEENFKQVSAELRKFCELKG